jgi:inosine/xanthosine triphosphatase
MDIAVGSGNPVKLAATERAARSLDASVRAVAVASGVPEQPRGRGETVRGAENRARAALEGADLGVGIEGGVEESSGGLALIMWAAATDGTRLVRGGGPTLPLPSEIADRVRAGEELGPVMDDVLGEEGVARDQGAAGALTAGAIDRESALRHAVAGALAPWLSGHY